jgi:hypothetical protein
MERRTDPPIVRELATGAIAGTIATAVMSTLMLTAQRAGLLGEQPPRKLSDAVIDRVASGHVDERTRRLGTALVHLGIGATAAALHQWGRRLADRPRPAAVWGGVFGAVFWALNYGFVAPAIRIMPRPDHDRPGRAPVMLAANVLWGAVSAILGDRLARIPARSRDGARLAPMPDRARAAALLEEWRRVERQLSDATDARAKRALNDELTRIRADYQQAIDEATAANAPLPEAFPDLPAFDPDKPTD